MIYIINLDHQKLLYEVTVADGNELIGWRNIMIKDNNHHQTLIVNGLDRACFFGVLYSFK